MFFTTSVYLLSTLIAVESAIAVLLKNRRSPVNIIYSVMSADFALCSLSLCHITSAPHAGFCRLWYNISIPFGCLLGMLMLNFILALTCKTIASNKLIILLLYTLPVSFSLIMINGDSFRSIFFRTEWGWEPALLFTSNWAHLFIVFFIITAIMGILIFIYWKSTLTAGPLKDLARKITFPILAGTAGLLLSPYFWHFTGQSNINMAMDMSGQLLFTGLIAGLRSPLIKFRSFEISPDTPVEELITAFDNPVFIILRGGKIVSYNRRAEEIIDIPLVEEQSSIYNIFDCPETMKNIIRNLISGKINRSKVRCSISAGRDGRRSFNLKIEPIKNSSGELTGVMVFVREDRTIEEFKKKYSITDRQLDIIFMSVSGLSNREIASCLKISEKTVENHLFNIYNKLGVDNKIELFNFTRIIDIIPH